MKPVRLPDVVLLTYAYRRHHVWDMRGEVGIEKQGYEYSMMIDEADHM